MERQNISKPLHDLLSCLRLIPSRNHEHSKRWKEVVQQLADGSHRLGPYCVCITNGDNVGFKKKGAKCGYKQFILFQDIVLDPPRLEELHIYSRGGAQCLPREPSHDWLELVEQDKSKNTLADDVVKVRDEDYVALSKIVLESIRFVIELQIANGGVKAGDRILRPGYFVDETTLNHLRDCNFTYAEPSEIDGLEENEDIEFAGTGTARELEVESEVAQEEAASLFYGHSTTLNSVYADLAKKSSVAMIADYTWKLRVKILRAYWELHHRDDDFDTAPPPPAALGAFFCCDGAPAAMLAQLIALDNRRFYLGDEESSMPPNLFVADEGSKSAEDKAFEGWLDELDSKFGFIGKGNDAGSRFKGKFKAFFGGFHACMKLYNCCGTMFGNFVEKFFGEVLAESEHASTEGEDDDDTDDADGATTARTKKVTT